MQPRLVLNRAHVDKFYFRINMIVLGIILSALLGIAIGGLLNVVIFRTKADAALLKPKSTCHTCLEPIAFLDTIPVVSYISLRGRCRSCATVIEWQYPAVELAMGILTTLLFLRVALGFGIPEFVDSSELILLFVRDVVVVSFLMVIFVYDYRFSVILDRFSVPAILAILIFNLALGASIVWFVLGGLLIGTFFAVQYLISQGKWVGDGDVRMGLLMGFLLGPQLGLLALLFSYIFGGIGGLLLVLSKKRALSSHVPFGTFMACAIVFVMFFGEWILGWYLGV